jgi:uncharacterized C2H2 Zn-finger protein
MLDGKLLKSLNALVRQKRSLTAQARTVAKTETQLMDHLSRALSPVGYRVVPASGPQSRSARLAARNGTSGAPKRLKCPRCDRRFAHALPMSRHIAATHKRAAARSHAGAKAQAKRSA